LGDEINNYSDVERERDPTTPLKGKEMPEVKIGKDGKKSKKGLLRRNELSKMSLSSFDY